MTAATGRAGAVRRIGFIGLGVMGEPICRHLARRSGADVAVFDTDPGAVSRIAGDGVQPMPAISGLAAACDLVFLSLPSGEVVERVARDASGLLAHARAGQCVVDLGTTAVDTTRALARDFAQAGAVFVDAPVARTRAAAEAGTLSVMVGADAAVFEQLRPVLALFAADITHCGPAGCGQIVKILNNMVLFETVLALAEAKAIAERAGVGGAPLFDALSKGSADSFALRNHGMKAMVPGEFPERAFSVAYARKDLRYALDLAAQAGIDARGALAVDGWLAAAAEAGLADRYHPVIARLVAKDPLP